MKRSTEGRELKVIKRPKSENRGSPKETVQAGLKILAKIIARGAVKEQQTETNVLKPDSSSSDAIPAELSIHG